MSPNAIAVHMRSMTSSLGLDLSDLGIDDDLTPETGADDVAPVQLPAGSTLTIGSVLAKALYSIWHGDPVIVVDSPPGSGKTTMVVDMVAALVERSDLKIVIATPTRRGAYDIAERIAARLGLDKDGNPRVAMSVRNMEPPAGVGGGGRGEANLPVVQGEQPPRVRHHDLRRGLPDDVRGRRIRCRLRRPGGLRR